VHLHTTVALPLGAALIAAGVLGYALAILRAVRRVRRQYSRGMIGGRSLRVGTGLNAAVRFLPLLLLVAAGVAVILLGR
jgi:hypothetical protein